MDQLHDRLDALEHHVHTLHQQTHALARRLRWWRGLAYGLLGLGLVSLLLPSATVQGEGGGLPALEERVAALEELLEPFTRVGTEVVITKANLHIVNGLGRTDCGTEEEPIPDCPNGLGNLIVGYNEPREFEGTENIRTGSHNVVVGQEHNFSRFGGLVVGLRNEISGNFTVVSSGTGNMASADLASVSGGQGNTASSGGASVSGGFGNTASGLSASVSGGQNIIQENDLGWAAGLFGDEISGSFRSP
jgi:hypothetical protein